MVLFYFSSLILQFKIRDYLSIKLSRTPVIKQTYQDFKKYVKKQFTGDTIELLQELLAYASRFEQLITGKSPIKVIEPILTRLIFFEATVTRPFLMEVLRLSEDQGDGVQLTSDDLVDILTIVESYIFRRQICDIPANSLNKTFVSLHNEIVSIDGTLDAYVDKLKYILLKKQASGIFPDNELFQEYLAHKQIYLMSSKNKQYIMERYENFGTREVKNVYELISNGDYSIEHIMPQTMSQDWKNMLGEDWQEIHETWLHRLANLTLTAYNSKYQNASFERKKTIENGYRDSGLRMNQRIANYDAWGLAELEDRNEHLVERALDIWPMIETNFEPEIEVQDRISLGEEFSFTGRLLDSYEILEEIREPYSWKEMFVDVLEVLYELDPQPLIDIANNRENELTYYFDNYQSHQRFTKFKEGIFINTNTNTDTKVRVLRQVFELYEMPEEDLVFVLSPED